MSDPIVPLDHQLLTAEDVSELLRLPVSRSTTWPVPEGFPISRCDSARVISKCIWPSAAAPRSRLGSESAG